MSTLPELLIPPAAAERTTPRERTAARDDEPGFADRLENERAKPADELPKQTSHARNDDREANTVAERSDSAKKAEPTDSADTAEPSALPETAPNENSEQAPSAPLAITDPSVAVESGSNLEETPVASDLLLEPIDTPIEPVETTSGGATGAIMVTARSGESIPLVPPQATSQTDPGALGRWFAKVVGPAESPQGQSAGLLNKLASQTSPQALNGVTADGASDGNIASTQQGNAPQAGTMSFADALAAGSTQDAVMTNAGMDAQTLDALVTQALNKASAALEAGGTNGPTMTTGQTTATGAQAAMTAVPQAATGQAVPVTALAVEITRQAMNGKTQFDIRLDPPELGRLNVRLEMDASGQTRTHMVVERAETLEMLTTDARSLERALQQAGLKTEPGSVSFELAQDAADGFAQDQQSGGTDDQKSGTDLADTASQEQGDATLGDDIASPEAIRHQLSVTGHLDVRI